jgi:hypothetical protein
MEKKISEFENGPDAKMIGILDMSLKVPEFIIILLLIHRILITIS